MAQDKKAQKQQKREYDWFEDPFNDEKTANELEEAKRAQRRGYVIAVIVAVLVIVVLSVIFFMVFTL